jgi:hypothetical protein
MSVYDSRSKPAYSEFKGDPKYLDNPHIFKWWRSDHDELIKKTIYNEQWNWPWKITDKIIGITPSKAIDDWKKDDSLCKKYAWYNVLMYFAVSRAEKLGYTETIRKPEWKKCKICKKKFIESSLPAPLINRLGIDRLDFCSICLCKIFFYGNDSASKEDIIVYLKKMSKILERVPPQDFGKGTDDFIDFSDE